MTGTRSQALAIVGGSILFFILTALFVTYFGTRFIYMGILFAAILGVAFLLGIILSLPGVKQFTAKVAGLVKREKRKICIGVVFLLLTAVLGLLFLEKGYSFVTRHRIEFFWLLFFPGIFFVPYLFGVIVSRLQSRP